MIAERVMIHSIIGDDIGGVINEGDVRKPGRCALKTPTFEDF